MNGQILLLLITLLVSNKGHAIANEAVADPYYSSHARGWYWYESQPEEVPIQAASGEEEGQADEN